MAYYQATGKRKLLDIMCRFAAIYDYGLRAWRRADSGLLRHEEIELALVKLARVTAKRRYLDLRSSSSTSACTEPHFFTEEAKRDAAIRRVSSRRPMNTVRRQPVREQKRSSATRARDVSLFRYGRHRDRIQGRQPDGGLGKRCGTTSPRSRCTSPAVSVRQPRTGFHLLLRPANDTAYAETCASVGLVFWASRMLGRGPNRRYADVMEQALYNGRLAGLRSTARPSSTTTR